MQFPRKKTRTPDKIAAQNAVDNTSSVSFCFPAPTLCAMQTLTPMAKIHEEVHNRSGRTDSRHRLVSDKAPYHNDIRRIKEKLQHPGEHKRKAETYDFRENTSLRHIDFIALFHFSSYLYHSFRL